MVPVNLCNNLLHKLLVMVRIRDLRAPNAFFQVGQEVLVVLC
jgi:hypothetical protein